jgi:Fe2+ transport system protein FeoA
VKLAEASIATPQRVTAVVMRDDDDQIARRLMELGFIAGAIVEVRHRAPLANDPLAVLVRGMVVALRRYEAERIMIEPAEGAST